MLLDCVLNMYLSVCNINSSFKNKISYVYIYIYIYIKSYILMCIFCPKNVVIINVLKKIIKND